MSTHTDIQTKYGMLTLNTVGDAKMAQALMRGEYPNEPLFSIMRSSLTQSSVVVDIGAHVGTFAVPAGAIAGQVIAFEPFAGSFELLSRNTSANRGTFRLINKGLGRVPGRASLVERNDANAGANTLVEGGDIEITTLDTEVKAADFIKIDVEGMELEVLEGGKELLKNAHPLVFFEVNLSQLRSHGASPRALERFFKRMGYMLYIPLEREAGVTLSRVRSATLMTAFIAPRAWALHQPSAPFDLLAVPYGYTLKIPTAGFGAALWSALKDNVHHKVRRARSLFA